MPNWFQQGGIDHGLADQDATEFRLQSAFVPCRSRRRRNASGSSARSRPGKKKKRGIYADPAGTSKEDLEDKVADFSYQNDVLAQLIVEMWSGTPAI